MSGSAVDNEFEVEEIRGYLKFKDAYNFREVIRFNPSCRGSRVHSKYVYLIKWRDFGENENTWEPEENIDDGEILFDFKKKMGIKLGRAEHKGVFDFDVPADPYYNKRRFEKLLARNMKRAGTKEVRKSSHHVQADIDSDLQCSSKSDLDKEQGDKSEPDRSEVRYSEAAIAELFGEDEISKEVPVTVISCEKDLKRHASEETASKKHNDHKEDFGCSKVRSSEAAIAQLFGEDENSMEVPVTAKSSDNDLKSRAAEESTSKEHSKRNDDKEDCDLSPKLVHVKMCKQIPNFRGPTIVQQVAMHRRWSSSERLNERWRKTVDIKVALQRHEAVTSKIFSVFTEMSRKYPHKKELIAKGQLLYMRQHVNYSELRESELQHISNCTDPADITQNKSAPQMNRLSSIELEELDSSTSQSISRTVTPKTVIVVNTPEVLAKSNSSSDTTTKTLDPGRIIEDGETEADYQKAIESFLAEDYAVEGLDSVCTEKMSRTNLMKRVEIRLKSLILPVTTRLRQLGYDHNSYSLPLLHKACACYYLGYIKEFSYLLCFLSSDVRWAVTKIVPLEVPLCLPELETIRWKRYESERNLTRTSQHNRSPKCIVDKRSTLIPCGSYYDGQHFVKVNVDGSGTFSPILSLLDSDLFDDSDGAAMPRQCGKDHLKCSLLHRLVEYAPDKRSAFAFASITPKGEIIKPVSPLSASHLFAMVGYAARCQLEKIFSDGMPMQLIPMVKIFTYKMTPDVMDFLRPLGYENFEAHSGPMLMYVTFVHVLVSRCTLGDLRSFIGLGIDTNSLAFHPGQKKRPTLVLTSLLKLRIIVDKEIRSRPDVLKRFELNTNFINAHNLRLSKWIHDQSSDRIVNAYRAVQADDISILGALTPVHTVRFTDAHSDNMSYSVVTLCSPMFSDVDLSFDEIRAGVSRNAFHVVVAVVPFKFSSESGDELVPTACEHPGVGIDRILVSASPLERWSKEPYLQNGLFFRIQPEIFESSGLCDRNSASRLLLEVDGPCVVGQLAMLQVFLVGNVDYARQDAELANPLVV